MRSRQREEEQGQMAGRRNGGRRDDREEGPEDQEHRRALPEAEHAGKGGGDARPRGIQVGGRAGARRGREDEGRCRRRASRREAGRLRRAAALRGAREVHRLLPGDEQDHPDDPRRLPLQRPPYRARQARPGPRQRGDDRRRQRVVEAQDRPGHGARHAQQSPSSSASGSTPSC